MDWCSHVLSNNGTLALAMAAALNNTGRPIWLNFHCNGTYADCTCHPCTAHVCSDLPSMRCMLLSASALVVTRSHRSCCRVPSGWQQVECTSFTQSYNPWLICSIHSWRTGLDHQDNWAATSAIINELKDLAPNAGPYRWNDPDMLMVRVPTKSRLPLFTPQMCSMFRLVARAATTLRLASAAQAKPT